MLSSSSPRICDTQGPGVEPAALIATALSQNGVPAALWGLHASALYDGELVPLVRLLSQFSLVVANMFNAGY